MQSMATIVMALRNGGVAVVPTESSYALAARVAPDTPSASACARIATLKGRPPGKAFPVVATRGQLVTLVDAPWALRLTKLFAANFWPGPLSVVVPARADLPHHVVDSGRIAIRVPNHAILAALCNSVGTPLTATSANQSGEPPVTDAERACALFPGVPSLDGDPLQGGAPSTLVSISDAFDVTLIRDGAVPWARAQTISEVLRG